MPFWVACHRIPKMVQTTDSNITKPSLPGSFTSPAAARESFFNRSSETSEGSQNHGIIQWSGLDHLVTALPTSFTSQAAQRPPNLHLSMIMKDLHVKTLHDNNSHASEQKAPSLPVHIVLLHRRSSNQKHAHQDFHREAIRNKWMSRYRAEATAATSGVFPIISLPLFCALLCSITKCSRALCHKPRVWKCWLK